MDFSDEEIMTCDGFCDVFLNSDLGS